MSTSNTVILQKFKLILLLNTTAVGEIKRKNVYFIPKNLTNLMHSKYYTETLIICLAFVKVVFKRKGKWVFFFEFMCQVHHLTWTCLIPHSGGNFVKIASKMYWRFYELQHALLQTLSTEAFVVCPIAFKHIKKAL